MFKKGFNEPYFYSHYLSTLVMLYFLFTRVCTIYLQEYLPFVYKSTVWCVFAQIPCSVYLAAKSPFTTGDVTAEAIISTSENRFGAMFFWNYGLYTNVEQ